MRILFACAVVLLALIGPALVLVSVAVRRRSEKQRHGFTVLASPTDQTASTRPGPRTGNGGGDPGTR